MDFETMMADMLHAQRVLLRTPTADQSLDSSMDSTFPRTTPSVAAARQAVVNAWLTSHDSPEASLAPGAVATSSNNRLVGIPDETNSRRAVDS